jgi:plastocyanin
VQDTDNGLKERNMQRNPLMATLAIIALAPILLLTPASASAGGSTTPAGAKENEVVIDNFSFKPAKLTVKVGTKVNWVNHDDAPHTVTSKARPRTFDSGSLDTDGRYSQVFNRPGTYDYFCAIHPRMTGQIVVK